MPVGPSAGAATPAPVIAVNVRGGIALDGLPCGMRYLLPSQVKLVLEGLTVGEIVEVLDPELAPDDVVIVPAGIAYPTREDDAAEVRVRFRPGLSLEHGTFDAPIAAVRALMATPSGTLGLEAVAVDDPAGGAPA